MRIRREQFERLAEDQLHRFAAEMVPLIRDLWPPDADRISTLDLQRLAENSIRAARRFGFELDKDLVVFTAISVLVGSRFHDDAVVRRYLDDPLLPRHECMRRIVREIPSSEWARIRAEQQGTASAG
jgi:hypothetical protein